MRLVDTIPWGECCLKDIEEILTKAKAEQKNMKQMVNLLNKKQKTSVALRGEIRKALREARREQRERLRRL